MTTEQFLKPVADIAATTTVVATGLQILPPIAALFAICYYIVVIVEKATGKTLHQLLTERKENEDSM